MELVAVALAIIYLLLAVKQNILCWPAAIISSSLYFFIMYSAGLYMEAYLQIFYVFMGFYGWSQWNSNEARLIVRTWAKRNHLFAFSSIILLTLVSGYTLQTYTDAVFPFIDAFTTWGAIIATYMVAKKLIENWIYWFVIDAISVFLFLSRDLVFTSLLFVSYLIIIYFGYKSWKKILKEQKKETIKQAIVSFILARIM